MSAERTRILLADDHPLFRDGLRALLASVPDMEVVGEAGAATRRSQARSNSNPNWS